MRGLIFLGKRYYPRGTITVTVNKTRVCHEKGLPATGLVFERGLISRGAAEILG